MIFLAIIAPNGTETHIKWKGHNSITDAEKEISYVRNSMICQKKIPYDCYIYEADNPPYGHRSYELDEIDMNFYEEKTMEQKLAEEQKAIDDLKNLAEKIKENHYKEQTT